MMKGEANMSQYSDQIRRDFKAGDDIRDAGLTTPNDVARFDDIAYGDESPLQRLDVYRPRVAEGRRLPVIVSIHGGGWVYGDKERYQYYCMSLAQKGFAVVNFSYRLAPEWKYPAGIEDANAVFTWLLVHADEYGFDAGHVFAVGDSAGAHMLALYSCICTNPDYAARYDFAPPKGFKPTAVALNCGAYIVDASGESSTSTLMADLLPKGGTAEEVALVSPLAHITADFPPAFIMTSNDDFLKPQAPLLAARLMELEVPFALRFYGDKTTRLSHVFHCDMRSAEGARCNAEECGWFKRFI